MDQGIRSNNVLDLRYTFNSERDSWTESQMMKKKILHAVGIQIREEIAILITDKVGFKPRLIKRNKKVC